MWHVQFGVNLLLLCCHNASLILHMVDLLGGLQHLSSLLPDLLILEIHKSGFFTCGLKHLCLLLCEIRHMAELGNPFPLFKLLSSGLTSVRDRP